jgi:hypothetical protein
MRCMLYARALFFGILRDRRCFREIVNPVTAMYRCQNMRYMRTMRRMFPRLFSVIEPIPRWYVGSYEYDWCWSCRVCRPCGGYGGRCVVCVIRNCPSYLFGTASHIIHVLLYILTLSIHLSDCTFEGSILYGSPEVRKYLRCTLSFSKVVLFY